jgi:hypothetical protein
MTAIRPAAALLIAFALAGCSRSELRIVPARVSGCPEMHGAIVSVAWDARRTGVKNVRIALTRPGGGERQWLQGPPAGRRKTGPWAVDGLTFILRDVKGRELARRTIESSPCPRRLRHD